MVFHIIKRNKKMKKALIVGSLLLMSMLTIQTHSMDRLKSAKNAVMAKINKMLGKTDSKAQKKHYTQITLELGPDKYIIEFDFDGTVIAKSPYANLIYKNLHVFFYNLILRHPATFAELLTSKACSEEWQETFKGLNDNKESYEHRMANVIQQISQGKYIIPGMQEVLEQLHAKGFELQGMTNMGKKDLEYLQQKYPHLVNLFSHITCVTYEKGKKIVKKPNPEYFTNFIETAKQNNMNPDNKKYLLIDDSRENCEVAVKVADFDAITVPGNDTNAAYIEKVFLEAGCSLETDK